LGCLVIGAVAGVMTDARAQRAPATESLSAESGYEQFAFDAADTDGDERISEAEFVRDAAAGFSGLDRDRDGKLTPAELGHPDPRRFACVDADGDGALAFKEVMTFKMKAFKAGDKDGDGTLSYDEVVDSVAQDRGC
jgi:Ca2+-binding EF-hand superfamily protein